MWHARSNDNENKLLIRRNTSEMRSGQDVSDDIHETFLKNDQNNLVPHNTMHNLNGSR